LPLVASRESEMAVDGRARIVDRLLDDNRVLLAGSGFPSLARLPVEFKTLRAGQMYPGDFH
jgi:hypothetical protein